MEQYIDKSVLVAEIEKRRNDYINSLMTEQVHVLNDVLDFIDTQEMKEVDIEKEINNFGLYYDGIVLDRKELIEFAKHFFELGLKAQKGEEV